MSTLFACSECGKTYASRGSLSRHGTYQTTFLGVTQQLTENLERNHNNTKRVTCPECNVSFRTSALNCTTFPQALRSLCMACQPMLCFEACVLRNSAAVAFIVDPMSRTVGDKTRISLKKRLSVLKHQLTLRHINRTG